MNDRSADRTTRPGRPRQGEVEARILSLLDTATNVFVRNGYAATSLEQIASTAKVGKPTIYARFGNKTGLFKAVVAHVLKHRTRRIDDPISARTGVAALKEQLGNMIAAALEPSYLGLFRLYLLEGSRFPELADAVAGSGEPRRLLVAQIEKYEEFRPLVAYKEELAEMLENLMGMLVTIASIDPGRRAAVCPRSEASRYVDVCLFGFYGRAATEVDAETPA